MSFSYKNRVALYLPFIMIAALFLTISLSGSLLFSLFSLFLDTVTGSGFPPFLGIIWFAFVGIAVFCLLSALYFRSRPFLLGDEAGLTVRKGWQTHRLSWQDIQSITHVMKKEHPLIRRRGLLDKPYFEYLLINSSDQKSLSLEITYIEGEAVPCCRCWARALKTSKQTTGQNKSLFIYRI